MEGKEYIFRTAAENKLGLGPWFESAPYIAKMPFGEYRRCTFNTLHVYKACFLFFLDPPDAPNTLEVNDVSKNSITVSWNEPNNGGDTIIGYWLEKKDTRTTRWSRVARERIRDLSYQVGTLSNTNKERF